MLIFGPANVVEDLGLRKLGLFVVSCCRDSSSVVDASCGTRALRSDKEHEESHLRVLAIWEL